MPITLSGGALLDAKVMLPSWGWYTPVMELNSDVFPAPLGPITARISPRRIASDTSRSETTPPKRSVTCCTSIKRSSLTARLQ